MNGQEQDGRRLRQAVRCTLEGDGLEPWVRALLELRFPPEGARGATLSEAAAALGWSPAMAAHVEFAALCTIAAAEPSRAAAADPRAGATEWRGRRSRRRA